MARESQFGTVCSISEDCRDQLLAQMRHSSLDTWELNIQLPSKQTDNIDCVAAGQGFSTVLNQNHAWDWSIFPSILRSLFVVQTRAGVHNLIGEERVSLRGPINFDFLAALLLFCLCSVWKPSFHTQQHSHHSMGLSDSNQHVVLALYGLHLETG